MKVTKRPSSLCADATIVEASAPGGAEPGCLVSFGYVDGKLLIDVYRVSGVVKVRTGDARFAIHQKPGVEVAVVIDATKKGGS